MIPADDEQIHCHLDAVSHQINLAPVDFLPSDANFARRNPRERCEEKEFTVEDPRGGVEEGVEVRCCSARMQFEPEYTISSGNPREDVDAPALRIPYCSNPEYV